VKRAVSLDGKRRKIIHKTTAAGGKSERGKYNSKRLEIKIRWNQMIPADFYFQKGLWRRGV